MPVNNSASTDAPLANNGPKTLVESAYRKLRRDIVEGQLLPGEKLRVEHLKNDYGVGSGTLREALSLLISDALVISQGQRGFWVAPMSLTDFEDITRTRAMLECEALKLSIAHGDDAWEGDLMAAFHRLSRAEEKLGEEGSRDEWEERNRVFHETLISAAPSRWIKHFLAILYRQSERYRRLSMYSRPIPRDIHVEHSEILEATLARDAKRASEVLVQHISLTLDGLLKLPPELFLVPSVPAH